MLIEDIQKIEEKFYKERCEMVLPELLCAYFEQGKYEVTYYFSDEYQNIFEQAKFYQMMSLMELGYKTEAGRLYHKRKGEWFNLCKQGKIYWKHVALFVILFKDFDISEYYEAQFSNYYEDVYVQLTELLQEEPIENVINTDCFEKAKTRNPIIGDIWEIKRNIKPQIVTFENIKWSIWTKYNNKIGTGQKYGMETVYEQEGISIYSYKPKDVSASMHIITDGITTIVLDCGCEIVDSETVRIETKEIFDYYNLGSIDAVFISHAHMDHYGSLNEMKKERIYMTSVTKQLIRLSSPETALSSVNILEPYSSVDVGGVMVTFFPNGHVQGSVLMDIDWKGKKRIVYTGDFSVEAHKTVVGLHIEDIFLKNEKRIDILLTETTYGRRNDMLSLEQYEKLFLELCEKQILYGNKVLIPCFAIGRVQEVAVLLSDMVRKNGKKILIDGMAARVTEFYQMSMGENILNSNISVCNSELEYSEKIMNHDIILASSGMMKSGSTSARYVEEMMDKENMAVMKVGFIRASEHMLMSIVNRKEKNISYYDIPLSAHVSYRYLVETLDRLSPDCVIYVHGSGIVH